MEQFYFAWINPGAAFNPDVHAREDEKVISFSFTHAEGEFAQLTLKVRNPRIGLLNPGRNIWAWFSRDGGSGAQPLFLGRLIGIPQDMQGETVEIQLTARPDDYDTQKAALADPLKVLPYWDPVLIAPDKRTDPDEVLEARSAHWHIDPVTHAVTISSIVTGEGGTITFDRILETKVSYSEPPATIVSCRAEFRWKQGAMGSLNLSRSIERAFAAQQGFMVNGYLWTYTGGGLIDSWPKVGAGIGAGWTVGTSVAERVDGKEVPGYDFTINVATGGFSQQKMGATYVVVFQEPGESNFEPTPTDGPVFEPVGGWSPESNAPFQVKLTDPRYYHDDSNDVGVPCTVDFACWAIKGTFIVNYATQRDRIEVVTCSLAAGVQALTSSHEADALSIDLTTAEVDQPIDAGGALPIGDVRRSSYMLTDRGKQSLEYLIALMSARLRARARAVTVAISVPFDDAVGVVSLRKGGTVNDDRLPGGIATGKIVSYTLALDGNTGKASASVTLACMIGLDDMVAGSAGTPTYVAIGYADAGYADAGYQVYSGGTNVAGVGDVTWDNFDGTPIDDDGIDFFNLTPAGAINTLVVVNGMLAQETVLTTPPAPAAMYTDAQAAITALNEAETQVALTLKPLNRSEPFTTNFPITLSQLALPNGIDLEADSL